MAGGLDWRGVIGRLCYPPTCVLCGAAGQGGRDLCAGCAADLPRNPHPCARCAAPLPPAAPAGSLCGPCQRRPLPFDACIAPFLYQFPLPQLAVGLKFHGRLGLSRLLGELLAEALSARNAPPPRALIPVPLHPSRLRERGYNQALEIARALVRVAPMPLAPQWVERTRATRPQTELEGLARRRNLRGAFAVAAGVRIPAEVALLDDVITTGATAGELARVLKRHGAERVEVWAVVRAG